MKEQIRVVIVDDHPGVRAGIKRLLTTAKEITVVGEGADGLEAVHLADQYIPDVMLLDVELPKLRGDDAVRIIRESQPGIKVLAVSSYNDRLYVQGMMENGASGYITKDEAPEMLIEAVRRVYQGPTRWVSPKASKNMPIGMAAEVSQPSKVREVPPMPYEKLSSLPENVRSVLPEHAQEIYQAAFNNAWEQYGHDEERAHKVAWTAVKNVYEKNERTGKWKIKK